MSSPPTDRAAGSASELERLFLVNLPHIDRVVGIQGRRHGFDGVETEEFSSWAKARLIDDGYAVFRKFAGKSSLQTYLTTVLINLLRDYRNTRWGRWRPSALAVRLGPVAIRLEEMLYRDRRPLREAIGAIVMVHPELRDGDVARLAERLPVRDRVTEVSLDASVRRGLEPVTEPAATRVDRDDSRQLIESVLRAAIEELSAEDAVILRMRFWSNLSIADIARALRLDQKALYRRVGAIQDRLRELCERHGVDRAIVADVIAGGDA